MNKVHDILEKIKRYQFWILCGLVTVIGMVAWWLSTSSLASTYTANKSKIESEAGKIDAVKIIVDHPNEKWNEAIGVKVKEAREKVADVWQRLYSEQEKMYVWPEQYFGQEFVNAAAPLAAQVRATGAPGGDLTTGQRGLYQAEVLKQFEELAKLLDAEYVNPIESGGAERGGYGGAAAPTELLPGQKPRKVIWSGQVELQQPYVWEEAPSTLAVLYAQEEIWVIKALCEAIAAANQDAGGAHDAAVKTIIAMSVGYEAAEEFPGGAGEPGRVTKVTPAPVAATGYGAGAGAEGGSSGGYGGGGSEGGAGATGGGKPRPPRPDRNRPVRDPVTAESVKPPPRRLPRTILLRTSTRGAMSKPTARHSTRPILVRSIASCRGASR